MPGYTKLFSSIIHSTIWRAPDHVRIVWITMLAMADRRGHVEASVPGLADAARVTVDQCSDALRALSSPDPWSRTATNEGRRIATDQGGWSVLNYCAYRERMTEEVLRQQVAERVRRHRARAAASRNAPCNENVSPVTPPDPAPCPTPNPNPNPDPDPKRRIGSTRSRKRDRTPPTVPAIVKDRIDRYEQQVRIRTGSPPPVQDRAWRAVLGRLLNSAPAGVEAEAWTATIDAALVAYVADDGRDGWLRRELWPAIYFAKHAARYLAAARSGGGNGHATAAGAPAEVLALVADMAGRGGSA